MELKIEYLPLEDIKPYAGNAKLHPAEQIEQIKNSIKEFGFDDPIAIWNGEIVEGHGRYIAAQELGIETVPIIKLDHLTDAQRRAYNIAHNKLTMNSGFNFELLQLELDALELDMTDFGFTEAEILELTVDDSEETGNAPLVGNIPQGNVYSGGESGSEYTESYPTSPSLPNDRRNTEDDLDLYEEKAETMVTKRVILVYRTDEEEIKLKKILGVEEDKMLGVVYDVANIPI